MGMQFLSFATPLQRECEFCVEIWDFFRGCVHSWKRFFVQRACEGLERSRKALQQHPVDPCIRKTAYAYVCSGSLETHRMGREWISFCLLGLGMTTNMVAMPLAKQAWPRTPSGHCLFLAFSFVVFLPMRNAIAHVANARSSSMRGAST